MKIIALFLSTASIALAQNLAGQPDCATACIISAVSAAGCAPADMGCQCGPSQAAIGASAAPCLLASCSISALLQAQSAGEAECASYSATLTAAAAGPAGTAEGEIGDPGSIGRGYYAAGSTVTATVPTSSSTGAASSSAATAGGAVVTPAVVGAGALLGMLGAAAAM